MNKATSDLVLLFKDLIHRWKAKGDQFDYFRLPLEALLVEINDGSFFQRSSEEQKGLLFGIRGQYTGKGEVLRVMIPDPEENAEYLPMFRQIISNFVEQLD
jgi:hypothetical protein